MRDLAFREFESHGYTGKRRTVSFGRHYGCSACHLRKADPIPEWLLALREVSAAFAGLGPESLWHVLVRTGRASALPRSRALMWGSGC